MTGSYYRSARKLAQKEFRYCVSRGEYPWLPRLDEFVPEERILRGVSLGLVQIPMELIAGSRSAGRTNAFTRNFMPILPEGSEFADKWSRLCETHLAEGIRDPIKALEYMNRYYVEEGNKRVSVLKFFEAASVAANVTRVLPERNGSAEVELYYEYVDFYKYSKVNFLEFSRPGSYAELQRRLGKQPGELWTDADRSALLSAAHYFRKAYEQRGGDALSTTVGDALLTFLRVYGYPALRGKSAAELKKPLDKIWEEIALQQEQLPIDVKKAPAEEKKPPLTRLMGKKMLNIALIHDKTPESSGWTWGHELAKEHLARVFDGEATVCSRFQALDAAEGESPEEHAFSVISRAVEEGNTVIFTTSPRLLPASLRAAVEYPGAIIMNCSLNQPHRYIRTYYARMYEAKFIIGAIAGALAGRDKIGYVGDYPIYGQIAGVNAFALGVQLTNPGASVMLEWSAVGGVSEAVGRLVNKGIRLISFQDLAKRGAEHTGVGLSLIQDGHQLRLAVPVWQWGLYYEGLIREIRSRIMKTEYEESSKALNYYWGMSAGVVELRCTENLPESGHKLAALLRRGICSGTVLPFEGPLYDQRHRLRWERREELDMERIIRMDWLNENIIGGIPAYGEMDETGKGTVSIAGVESVAKDAKAGM